MQDNSHSPPEGAMGSQGKTRQLLLFLAYEYGVFFLASCLFAEDTVSGAWINSFAALLLLGLVVPLSVYVIVLAGRCWRDRTANRYLALGVIGLSLVLVNPCVSGVLAHALSPSLEGLVRTFAELERIIRYL